MSYLGASLSGNAAPSGALLDTGLSANVRFVHQSVLQKTYHDLLGASPSQVNQLLATLNAKVSSLPLDQQQLFRELYARFGSADPRTPAGLGQAGAVAAAATTSSSIMNGVLIAAQITAALAGVGLAVYQVRQQAIDRRNAQHTQDAQIRQQAAIVQEQIQQQQVVQQQQAVQDTKATSATPMILGAAAIGTAFLLTR